MEKLHGFFWSGDFDKYFLGHQFEEIYKARIYAPYLEGVKDAVVLDVGGNIGAFTLYASKYAKQVYTLEPSMIHFNTLSHMVNFNELKNVKLIKKALYLESKDSMPFGGPDDNRTMRSLHSATWKGGVPDENVQSVSLDDLFDQEKIEHVNLMKLDIEGTEDEVICSEGFSKVADKIDVIIGETHSWSGRHPQQIKDAFKDNGFIMETIENDAQIFVAKKPQKAGTKV